MPDTRASKQRRDDDFDAIMKGLNEAIADAEDAPKGACVHVPDSNDDKGSDAKS